MKKHGSSKFEFANDESDAEMLWQNRKEALYATLGANPGMRCWTTDVWFVSSSPSLPPYSFKRSALLMDETASLYPNYPN